MGVSFKGWVLQRWASSRWQSAVRQKHKSGFSHRERLDVVENRSTQSKLKTKPPLYNKYMLLRMDSKMGLSYKTYWENISVSFYELPTNTFVNLKHHADYLINEE